MFLGDKKDGIPSLIFKMIRFLDYGRKERSDGIASKQMRLVRVSMMIISFIHKD